MAGRTHPIRASRSCPVCGTPVPWQRYCLKAWVWAKWPCPQCGTTLTFDFTRRMIVGGTSPIIVAAGYVAIEMFNLPGWATAIVACIAGLTAAIVFGLFDRVTVAYGRSRSFCPNCQYDLRGSLNAGRVDCPECGKRCR